ncbi:hypothetical protein FHW36_101372 [Chitinophaga polysaccharea]|uniref:Uncharacterized protein n=1 Tax=Chitinophaga polysaccharea TaxID=1293035 RepID=A0A561Q262_9BACT|nr:hypothetical protein [Chitinophaga polysaccharea]TWF44452.1 hypothetical protein FHW36_101372 [Chitinophaga polysaccharea]
MLLFNYIKRAGPKVLEPVVIQITTTLLCVAGAALAAIGVQTLKTAISNPVISLKKE